MRRRAAVVTYPDLEQITEDINFVGAPTCVLRKLFEQLEFVCALGT